MMGFEIASGVVEHEGAHVSTHGADYDAAIQWLRERGNGASTWGDEGLFGTFAAAYAECTRIGLSALTGLSGEIDGTGECMVGVSKNARDMENTNTENMGRIWA
ncbi:hypothetical protein [Streptosporangium subroseum]|uniref:hypothetical protein n=1 Tax=Streptosporangium subroseum TaxID=106412 RepID=UPI0030889E24|nr:hypothetical protein OHB15_49600 [Streptosporangium subroseum]